MASIVLPNHLAENVSRDRFVAQMQLATDASMPTLQEDASVLGLHPLQRLSIDDSLMKAAKSICERERVDFSSLSQIQRKFLTHYRCGQCGLLPLYFLNLLHVTRVRCRKCGQLTAFKRKGKYGKLRKEIAFQLAKEISGNV